MFKLIIAKFHEPKTLRIVKTITDIAAKEYAVQCATEKLESDVRNMEFTFDNGPVAGSKITRKV